MHVGIEPCSWRLLTDLLTRTRVNHALERLLAWKFSRKPYEKSYPVHKALHYWRLLLCSATFTFNLASQNLNASIYPYGFRQVSLPATDRCGLVYGV
ncbi:hypothetical protein VNO77_07550 [Canavalia gladiata]|uniref:Uncharacterized protein n=1 Tax=Canavalia gladiata TaxID=3824 RepID=A0AAN9M7Q1_CANGL